MKNQLKYFISCCFLIVAMNFTALADQQQDPALIQSMLSKYSLLTPQILANRHYWLELALQNTLYFNEPGLLAGFGYRVHSLGFDLRFTKGKSSYGEIKRLAAHNTNTDSSENTEIDLQRNKSDKWSHWAIGPGFSVSNQFFSGFLSGLTERVRASFAYGNYRDEANNIPFKSYIFSADTSVIYQLKPTSPWSICGSLNWNTGMLVRDYKDTPIKSYGIPVSWVGSSLGLEYAF